MLGQTTRVASLRRAAAAIPTDVNRASGGYCTLRVRVLFFAEERVSTNSRGC